MLTGRLPFLDEGLNKTKRKVLRRNLEGVGSEVTNLIFDLLLNKDVERRNSSATEVMELIESSTTI